MPQRNAPRLYAAARYFTVSVTDVEWTSDPLVPVTVRVYVPVRAFLFAFTVMVELPLPAIEDGLKDTETPLFAPDADKLTVPVNPVVPVIVTVSPVELPLVTVIGVPALIPKSPVEAAVTVRLTVVLSTMLPDVPVTVTV